MAEETRFTAEPNSNPSDDSFDFQLTGSTVLSLELPCDLGEYRVLELIGSGGMGQVYRAEHKRMARPVALKTLRPELVMNKRAIDRFYAEVRAAARAMHANLVVAFDAGTSQDTHYLAMELVNGETLAQMVINGGPLGEVDAVRAIHDAALGLHAAHQAGVIHRDVKPSNLMRTFDGTIKVLDLGLATVASELDGQDGHGKLVGTVEFMAPEQMLRPDSVDRCADIYSLGATLFFLLVGRPPYTGTLVEQARSHRDSPPPDLYRYRHDVDLRLDQIVQRMLAKRPEDRYQSMSEVVAALQPLITSLETTKPAIPSLATVTEFGSTGFSAGSSSSTVSVLGIDLGLYYAASALANSDGTFIALPSAADDRPLLRCAVAFDGQQLFIGEEAIRFRATAPAQVTHSLQLYLGRSVIDRKLREHQMPPEAWLGLLLSHLRHANRQYGMKARKPLACAISVPACYGQAYRRAILRAAAIAQLPAPQLVDRPLAAASSQLNGEIAALPVPIPSILCHWLIVTVGGSAMEASVVRHIGGRFQMLASVGSTSVSIPTWHMRIADMVAGDCKRKFGADPRAQLHSAVALQIASEKALRGLLLSDKSELRFEFNQRQVSLVLTRDAMRAACHDLFAQLEGMIAEVISVSELSPAQFDRCLLLGSVARLPSVAQLVRNQLGADVEMQPIDQSALAHGVAMIAGSSVFGDGESLASQSCTTSDLGILAISQTEGRRPMSVLPKFTPLPTKKVRRLKRTAGSRMNELAIVESSGWQGQTWQSLGVYRSDLLLRAEMAELTFSLNEGGLLDLRLNDPATGKVETIGPFPATSLGENELKNWQDVISGLQRE